MTDVDVFGTGMELMVVSEGDGRLVVAIDGSGALDIEAEIGEKRPKPQGLLRGVGKCQVLGFHSGKGNSCLFLRRP